MGLWNEGLNKHNKKSNSSVQSSSIVEEQVTTHAASARKEIDWEERHFQICLAMLSCPVCNRHGHPDAPMLRHVVAQANKMVELLKQNAEKVAEHSGSECPETDEAKEGQIEAKQDKKRKIPQKGLWRPALVQSELFRELWNALNKLGYDKGSDVPYFHFNECCEELNIDVDSIDIERFAESYDVNIG